MAKGNASSTLSPFRFVTGAPVFEDDYREALEQSAHSAGYTPIVLAGGAVGAEGWFTEGNLRPEFDPANLNTWLDRYRGTFRVADDHKVLRLYGMAEFGAGNTGDVQLLVDGVVRAGLSFDAFTNDQWLSATFTVPAIGGAGEYDWTLQLRQTAGAATDNYVRSWSLGVEPVTVAADWPDPSG